MIRNNIYTVYRGKEFLIGRVDGKYQLFSTDLADIEARSFTIYERPKSFIASDGKEYRLPPRASDVPPLFIKILNPSEIGEVYSINTFGIYKDRKFPILEETDDQYMLGADDFIFDPETAKKFGFEMYLSGEYQKWVDKSEVEHVYEIKKPLPDFVR